MPDIELSSSIHRLPKYLPPPLVDLDYVVINNQTGEVGFRWTKEGKVSYTWDWPSEKLAAKELARI